MKNKKYNLYVGRDKEKVLESVDIETVIEEIYNQNNNFRIAVIGGLRGLKTAKAINNNIDLGYVEEVKAI